MGLSPVETLCQRHPLRGEVQCSETTPGWTLVTALSAPRIPWALAEETQVTGGDCPSGAAHEKVPHVSISLLISSALTHPDVLRGSSKSI